MSASSISLLDNVITAVEVGFSYDGIVSVPETGLEDAGQRPGLAGRIQRGMVRPLLLLPTITAMTGHGPRDSESDPEGAKKTWVSLFQSSAYPESELTGVMARITPKRAPSMNDRAESPAHPDSDADDEKVKSPLAPMLQPP